MPIEIPETSVKAGMESELTTLLSTSSAVAAALSYSYFLASSTRSGTWRALSLLPVVCLFARLPFLFSTIHLRSFLFFFLWLSTFKLLLLAFHKGPLSHPHLPLPTFLLLGFLPIEIQKDQTKQRPPSPPPPAPLIPPLVGYTAKAALLSMLVSSYPNRNRYPRCLVVALYAVHTYLALDLVLAACAGMARLVLGPKVALVPQFSAPYLSSSLQDFWSKRWNIMVSRLLHLLVYAPVRARFGRHMGVVASFFISGLVHEGLFYCATLERQTGEATCFFVLHGLCVAVEIEAKARLSRRGWRPLPRAAATPLTVGFVMATAMMLLYLPLLRGNAEERGIAEWVAVLQAVKGTVGRASYTLRSI